jgi:hypothetical protein
MIKLNLKYYLTLRLKFFKFVTILKCIFFRSSLPILTQSIWAIYHLHMQIHFCIARISKKEYRFITNTACKNFFSKNGFYILGISDSGLSELATHVESLFSQKPLNKYRELIPNQDPLIANYVYKSLKSVENSIKSIYQSNFQTYWIKIYKTIPGENDPNSSFAWHQDADPRSALKIFIYLNNVNKNNGALNLFDRKISRSLFCKGFISSTPDFRIYSQKIISKKFLKLSKFIEGEAGTMFIFDNNLIHRGTFPVSGYRTVISIEILPSKEKLNYNNVMRGLSKQISDDFPSNPYQYKN